MQITCKLGDAKLPIPSSISDEDKSKTAVNATDSLRDLGSEMKSPADGESESSQLALRKSFQLLSTRHRAPGEDTAGAGWSCHPQVVPGLSAGVALSTQQLWLQKHAQVLEVPLSALLASPKRLHKNCFGLFS